MTTKMSEDTQEEESTHDGCIQDSSVSFDADENSTASQGHELENWIEHIKRSTKEADKKLLTYITNWFEIQKKLK